jgi:hypothetical protein
MNLFIVIALLLVSAQAPVARNLDNGIYLNSQKPSASTVRTQTGQVRHPGAKRNLKIQKSEIFSQDNANTQFWVSLTMPYDKNLDSSTYLMVVDGTAYEQNGSGSSQQVSSSLFFSISGEHKAKQVAKYLGAPIVYRKHPHHILRVRFLPKKLEFLPGEEVIATLQITNVGTNAIAFMKGGRNRASRDNQYVFSARLNGKQVEDIGSSDHAGGLAARRVLKPGEIFEDEISLSKWFAFNKSGLYEIHGSYYMDFNEPEANTWRTIWEDYVAADFTVTIK